MSKEHTPSNPWLDAWVAQFHKSSNMIAPGGVLVSFTGQQPSDKWVGWWSVFIRSLRANQDNSPLYKNVVHATPPSSPIRNCAANIRKVIAEHIESLGENAEEAEKKASQLPIATFRPGNIETLFNWIAKLPDSTAVAISCADRVRFPSVKTEPAVKTTDWTTDTQNLTTPGKLILPHIHELTRRCLQLTRGLNKCVVLFCEVDSSSQNPLPPDLAEDPDLATLNWKSEDTSATDEFAELLHSFSQGQISEGDAIGRVKQISEIPFDRVFMKSILLYTSNKPMAAWDEIVPLQTELTTRSPSDCLIIARIALAAGSLDAARGIAHELLSRHIELLEDLHGLYLLTERLQMSEKSAILERLQSEFPDDARVLSVILDQALKERRFTDAQALAQRLGMEYVKRLADDFARGDFEPHGFLNWAKENGRADDAYYDSAVEAWKRNLWAKSAEWVRSVSISGSRGKDAVKLRLKLLTRSLHDGVAVDAIFDEFRVLLRFVAETPHAAEAREALEDFLGSMDQTTSLAILAKVVMSELSRMRTEIWVSRDKHTPHPFGSLEDSSAEETSAFFEAYCRTQARSDLILGRGQLPAQLQGMASKRVMGVLYRTLDKVKFDEARLENDVQFSMLLLQCIVLIAKHLREPVADFLAARHLIGKLTRAMAYQHARAVGEMSLTVMASGQPEALPWRHAQGWFCVADAFERSRNTLGALQAFALGLCVHNEPERSWELTFGVLRLGARVLRNCGLLAFARDVIDLEIEARRELNMPPEPIEFRQFRLQLELMDVNSLTSDLQLVELINESASILRAEEFEAAPPLACLASLIRFFRERGLQVEPAIQELFLAKLQNIDEQVATTLRLTAMADIGREDIGMAIRAASSAENWEDLAFQLTPLRAALRTAVSTACQKRDSELFFVAANALSQPVLAIQSEMVEEQSSALNASIYRYAISAMGDRKLPDEEVARFFSKANSASPRSTHDLSNLLHVSTLNAQSILQKDESALLLVTDSHDSLCCLEISKDTVSDPTVIPESHWSEGRFREWSNKFPHGYDNWALTSEEITNTLAGLTPVSPPVSKHLTVVPETELFAFPFSLVRTGDDFLFAKATVAIAPSISWLRSNRLTKWSGRAEISAWLGNPASTDEALRTFRTEALPWLRRLGVQISREPMPSAVNGAAIAVVASHGRVGSLNNFSLLTDTENHFGPAEIGEILKGCGCVVLCVCSGGKADMALGSGEARGLVPELLRRGVRAVVAPLWPIQVRFAQLWLQPFLSKAREGAAINEAAAYAADECFLAHQHPYSKSLMQVFGDSFFVPLPK